MLVYDVLPVAQIKLQIVLNNDIVNSSGQKVVGNHRKKHEGVGWQIIMKETRRCPIVEENEEAAKGCVVARWRDGQYCKIMILL